MGNEKLNPDDSKCACIMLEYKPTLLSQTPSCHLGLGTFTCLKCSSSSLVYTLYAKNR